MMSVIETLFFKFKNKNIMKKPTQPIEKGTVLGICEYLTITDDYTVLYHALPVGTVKNDLSWFPEYSPRPIHSDIKEIVYIDNYRWGVKQLTTQLSEFEGLSNTVKVDILCDLLEKKQELNDLISLHNFEIMR
jgi:hypothetical protein